MVRQAAAENHYGRRTPNLWGSYCVQKHPRLEVFLSLETLRLDMDLGDEVRLMVDSQHDIADVTFRVSRSENIQ